MGPMALSFAAPAALVGLLALPLIYLLLRVTPPRPREVVFPPLKLLLDLIAKEQTPSRTPWPLLLLRLAIAACVILAMAGPVWSPAATTPIGKAPLLIAFDDGWPTAPSWDRRLRRATAIIEDAARAGAPTAFMPMSEGAVEPALEDGGKALERLRSARPKPFLVERGAAAARAAAFAKAHNGARIIWFADGLQQGAAADFARALQEAANSGASVEILSDSHVVRALMSPSNGPSGLEADVLRVDTQAPQEGRVLALDEKGRVVGRAPFDFGAAMTGKARFDLPTELRNDVSLLQIEGEPSAGAVALLDSALESASRRDRQWRRERSGATASFRRSIISTRRSRRSRRCGCRVRASQIRYWLCWTSARTSWRSPTSALCATTISTLSRVS